MQILTSFLNNIQRCFHDLIQLGTQLSLVKTFFISNQLFVKLFLFKFFVVSFSFDILFLFYDSESSKEVVVFVYLVLIAPEHSDDRPILSFFSFCLPVVPYYFNTLVRYPFGYINIYKFSKLFS